MVAMSFKKQANRISVALVIDALKEQCIDVTEAEATLKSLRVERDAMMYELKAAGIPERSLSKYTGLSVSAVAKITMGARRSSLALDLETNQPFSHI